MGVPTDTDGVTTDIAVTTDMATGGTGGAVMAVAIDGTVMAIGLTIGAIIATAIDGTATVIGLTGGAIMATDTKIAITRDFLRATERDDFKAYVRGA